MRWSGWRAGRSSARSSSRSSMKAMLRRAADRAVAAAGARAVRAGPAARAGPRGGAGRLPRAQFGPLLPVQRIALRQHPPRLPRTAAGRARADRARGLGQSRPHRLANTCISTGSGISTPRRRGRAASRSPPEVVARFLALRDDGKPALFFAAHLANWELPAIAAARHGLPSAVLYRTPNNPQVARDIVALRTDEHGPADPRQHRGADPHDGGAGPGPACRHADRPALRPRPAGALPGPAGHSNPLVAHLARRFDCPVHGARAIRVAGRPLPAGADRGGGAAARRHAAASMSPAATALMNRIVEGWVREHPGPVVVDAPPLAMRQSPANKGD